MSSPSPRRTRVDRSTAREQLMKHMGLFKDDNAQKPAMHVHPEGQLTVFFEPIPPRRKG
jgi:hypothetical protein